MNQGVTPKNNNGMADPTKKDNSNKTTLRLGVERAISDGYLQESQ